MILGDALADPEPSSKTKKNPTFLSGFFLGVRLILV